MNKNKHQLARYTGSLAGFDTELMKPNLLLFSSSDKMEVVVANWYPITFVGHWQIELFCVDNNVTLFYYFTSAIV